MLSALIVCAVLAMPIDAWEKAGSIPVPATLEPMAQR